MKRVLLLLSVISVKNCNPYFPSIDDIFKTLTEDNDNDFRRRITNPPNVVIKNITIDVEKLNISTITEKLKAIAGNFENTTGEDLILRDYKTRRLAYIGGIREWSNASAVLVKNKIFDLMLQLIYMARHKIKQIENEPYYNPSDTSYRIAFLYRRIRRIWKKMCDIFTTMSKNRHNRKKVFERVNPFLILHHKAAKLHVDFLYQWWLLIKMHERYDYHHAIPNTTPNDNVIPQHIIDSYKKNIFGE